MMRVQAKDFRAQWAALVAIIAIGFFLRAMNVDRWPLWNDEGLTLLIAQWPVGTLFLRPVDTMPGLYYALHKLLVGPMASVVAARSISLACGTLLIPAAYFCAKEARIPALLTASLVALSYWLIDYSQEARSYALLLLLVVLSAAFFIRWTRNERQVDLLATVLLNLCAFYTHPVSVFWIGPVSAAMLWLGRGKAILQLILAAILALPEVWRITQFPRNDFYWLLQASPGQAIETVARLVLPFRASGFWVPIIALVLAWRIWIKRARIGTWARNNRGAAIALAILLLSPLLIWLAGFASKPIFMTRTILIAVPGFLLALALLLRFEHRLARFAVLALYACSLLVTGTTRSKEDWRTIAARIGGGTILMCQPRQAGAMRHAQTTDNRMLLHYDQGLADIGRPESLVELYEILSSKKAMTDARQRALSTDGEMHPVWPIRSGRSEHLAQAPMSLAEAVASCRASRSDSAPAYIAD